MFDSKPKIKVLIIGKDGAARKFWVDHDATFFDNKYRIDYEAVFQTFEGGFLGIGGKQVPTILFRENSVVAISHKVKATVPDPDEMGSSISRAAWAIAELMRKKDEGRMQIMMILMAVACLVAGAGAYYGYNNDKKITELTVKVDSAISISQSPTQGNNTYVDQNGNRVPIVVRTPTVRPTGTPLPTNISHQVPA